MGRAELAGEPRFHRVAARGVLRRGVLDWRDAPRRLAAERYRGAPTAARFQVQDGAEGGEGDRVAALVVCSAAESVQY